MPPAVFLDTSFFSHCWRLSIDPQGTDRTRERSRLSIDHQGDVHFPIARYDPNLLLWLLGWMPTSRSIGARSLVLRQGKVALIGRVPVLGLIRSVFECGGIEFSGSLLNPPPSVAVEYDSSTYINNFPVPVHWTSPCVALIFRSFRRSQRRPMARAREAGVP
jgi:hypothetical protein